MLLKINCSAWKQGDKPGAGVCAKGHQGGLPAIHWCTNRCPAGERIPADPTDPRLLIVIEPPGSPTRSGGDPVGWETRGPLLWKEFHSWALTADPQATQEWLKEFDAKITCGDCRTHWRNWLQSHPPPPSGRDELFRWTVDAHNAVNRRLSKPEMPYEAAIQLWKTAPPTDPELPQPHAPPVEAPPFSARLPESPLPVLEAVKVDCVHVTARESPVAVTCGLGLFGGSPHVSMCRDCRRRTPANAPTNAPAETPAIIDAADAFAQFAPQLPQLPAARDVVAPPAEPDSLSAAPPAAPVCSPPGSELAERIVLRSHLSPGDVLMLTAAVRDLHRAYPGRFATAVDTSAPELWEHNPYVSGHDRSAGAWREVNMHYPLINQSNQRPVHFLHGYADFLASQLGVTFPVTEFKADLYVTDEEKGWMNQVQQRFGYAGRFWVIMAGGKYDFTAKWWPPAYYQRVVDHFLGHLQFVQCGQNGHWHPPLKGVFNLIGQTSIRQFIRLMYHADGVICPVTFAMHLAAAVPAKDGRLRPCVVIAGGREPPHWEAYPGHQFLHTIGCLPCCATGGCWKSRCQTVGDGDRKDREALCERPVQVENDLRVPQCMAMVQPAEVIRAIERFLSFSAHAR